MASTVSKKRTRRRTTSQRRAGSASRDEHRKELMKQAVREVLVEEREEIAWDREIAADAQAGKLDKLIESVREDIRQGKTEPLDPDSL